MMTSLRSNFCFIRLALARISIIVRLGESSMNNGADEICVVLSTMRCQSSSDRRPARIRDSSIPASADSNLMTISLRPISRLKIAAARWFLIAAARAKSRARVDFPMAGRAATMIIWPGMNPLVSSSRSVNPVGMPAMASPRASMASSSSKVLSNNSESGWYSSLVLRVETS